MGLPSKKRLVLGTALLILLSILGILGWQIVRNQNQQSEDTIKTPLWRPASELIEKGELEPPGKILEVNLKYDEKASPQVAISSLFVKNGYAPLYQEEAEGYKLQLLGKAGKQLSSLTFHIPNKIQGEGEGFLNEKADLVENKELVLKKIDFTLTLAFLQNATSLQIIDPKGVTILSMSLSDIEYIDNKPNFESIPGDQLRKGQGGLINLLEPALAQNSSPYLDITFISNGYTDMNLFHSDVARMSSYLVNTYEPFISRAYQIIFRSFDNTSSNLCSRDPTQQDFFLCSNSLIYQLLNNAGVPYDIIIVVTDSTQIGGNTDNFNPIAYIYNGDLSSRVFVHELGHALGKLIDEYLAVSVEGPIWNTVDKNCYRGTPTIEVWPGVPLSEYQQGCYYPNWWRSSNTSIMRGTATWEEYFNTVSQRILNQRMDLYTGGSGSPSPTPIPTPTPGLGAPTPTPVGGGGPGVPEGGACDPSDIYGNPPGQGNCQNGLLCSNATRRCYNPNATPAPTATGAPAPTPALTTNIFLQGCVFIDLNGDGKFNGVDRTNLSDPNWTAYCSQIANLGSEKGYTGTANLTIRGAPGTPCAGGTGVQVTTDITATGQYYAQLGGVCASPPPTVELTSPITVGPKAFTVRYGRVTAGMADFALSPTSQPRLVATSHNSGLGGTLTWFQNCASGANRMLIVTAASRVGGGVLPVSNFTYGGTPLSLLGTPAFNSSTGATIGVYYLINPNAGLNNINITYSAEMAFGASCWQGVVQTSPSISTTTAPSVSVSLPLL